MFLTDSSTSTIDSYLINVFGKFRSTIVDLHNKWYREESIKGESKKVYEVAMYYMAIYYVILIYLEVKDGYNTDWNYYKEKYLIDINRKKLACCGIDLDDIFASFGLPIVSNASCVNGINSMEIEHCFVIEPTTLETTSVSSSINISNYLSTPQVCTIYID